MNKKVSSEGSIWFWTAQRIKRDTAHQAFHNEHVSHLIPKVDYMASIDYVAKRVVDTLGLMERGKLRFFPLSSEKDAVAVEVRRLVKGKSRNDLPFLFSLGVTADDQFSNHQVEVLEFDATLCPEVAAEKQLVEAAATNVWRDACDYLTANDLTQALVALAKRQHGVLLREGGGVYFVTADKCGPYAGIAAALASHGPALHMVEFDPIVNASLIHHVCESVRQTLDETADALIAEAHDLSSRQAKPRKNGQRTRLQRLIEAEQLAEHMKNAFGVTFTTSCKTLQRAREAIGAEGIRMMTAGA